MIICSARLAFVNANYIDLVIILFRRVFANYILRKKLYILGQIFYSLIFISSMLNLLSLFAKLVDNFLSLEFEVLLQWLG